MVATMNVISGSMEGTMSHYMKTYFKKTEKDKETDMSLEPSKGNNLPEPELQSSEALSAIQYPKCKGMDLCCCRHLSLW